MQDKNKYNGMFEENENNSQHKYKINEIEDKYP
jgi:hypothetical protein